MQDNKSQGILDQNIDKKPMDAEIDTDMGKKPMEAEITIKNNGTDSDIKIEKEAEAKVPNIKSSEAVENNADIKEGVNNTADAKSSDAVPPETNMPEKKADETQQVEVKETEPEKTKAVNEAEKKHAFTVINHQKTDDKAKTDTIDDISAYYPDGDAEHIAEDDLAEKEGMVSLESEQKKSGKKNGLSKGQVALIVVCSVLAFLLIGFAWVTFYKPPQPTEDEIPFDTNPIEEPVEQRDIETESNTDDEPKKSGGYIPKEGQYNILVVGHDRTAFLADVTMIVNINTKDNSVSVVQIPRDTFISIEIPTNKINAYFPTYYGWNLSSPDADPDVEAMHYYAELLEKSLCIKIHNTVVMDLNGFQQIVDAVDGVDVYVQHDMYYYDPYQSLSIEIPAGWQHLDGYNAEGFVRFRYGYLQADIERGNAQKIFMTAFFNKVKSVVKSVDAGKLANLADAVFKNVHTDMSVADLIFYAKFALKVDLSSIQMMTMPGTTADVYYVLNRAATLDMINQYFNIYDTPISDSIFDRNYLFCATNWSTLSDVYFAPAEYYYNNTFSGDQIDNNELGLQFVY